METENEAIWTNENPESYFVQIRDKRFYHVVYENDEMTADEVVDVLSQYVNRPYIVRLHDNIIGEDVDSWKFVTSRMNDYESE